MMTSEKLVMSCDPCESSIPSMARCYAILQGLQSCQFQPVRRSSVTSHVSLLSPSCPLKSRLAQTSANDAPYMSLRSHEAYQRAGSFPTRFCRVGDCYCCAIAEAYQTSRAMLARSSVRRPHPGGGEQRPARQLTSQRHFVAVVSQWLRARDGQVRRLGRQLWRERLPF